MNQLNLSGYSRDTLEHVLHIVKTYRLSLKQIGKRAIIIDPSVQENVSARIEYATGMDESTVKSYAQACLKLSFSEYQSDVLPTIVENPRLTWGIRVYVGDDMVDISFQRFESLLKK